MKLIFTLLFVAICTSVFSQDCSGFTLVDLKKLKILSAQRAELEDFLIGKGYIKRNQDEFSKCRQVVGKNKDGDDIINSLHFVIFESNPHYLTYDMKTYIKIKSEAKKMFKLKDSYEDGTQVFTDGKYTYNFRANEANGDNMFNTFSILIRDNR